MIAAHLPFSASLGPTVVTQGVGGSTSHTGVLYHSWDFAVPFGTPILAIADGWVVDYFDGAASGQAGAGNAGNIITVRHEGGYSSAFHLEQGSIPEWIRAAVDAGGEARVLQGQLLGVVGNTGLLTGPHIHITAGAETVSWGASTGHSVLVANGHPGANGISPVSFAEAVAGIPTVGQALVSQNALLDGEAGSLSEADAILAGTFLSMVVYGGSVLPSTYRGALQDNDDERNYDDLYSAYLGSRDTPWTVLTEVDLNSARFLDDNGERLGSITPGGLYLSAATSVFEGNFNEAIAARTVINGEHTLILSFRGTDGIDGAGQAQTFFGPGLVQYYLGLRPFIAAVADYVADTSRQITNVIVAGHSLGGTVADLFFIVDAPAFSGVNLKVVSIASAGLPPDLEVGGELVAGSSLVADAIARAADGYVGVAHTNDRVSHSVEVTSISDYFDTNLSPNNVLQHNIHYFGFDLEIEVPRIDNVDVTYPSNPFEFVHGFGAEHNIELYWANLQAALHDPLYALRGTREIVVGLADYSRVPDFDGEHRARFQYWDGARTVGIDNDSGPGALEGSAQGDYILGLTGNDHLSGLAGNDLLSGGGGNDTVLGGTGNDTVHGGDNDDDLRGQENADSLFGGQGRDVLYGGEENDTLDGGGVGSGGGGDQLLGEDGDDILYGLDGANTYYGGPDADRFVFKGPIDFVDVVGDYNQGNLGRYDSSEGDVIDISPIVGAAFLGGQSETALWAVEYSSLDKKVRLLVDADGTGNDSLLRTVAILEGVPFGDAGIKVIVDPTGGASPPVPRSVLSPTGSYSISPASRVVNEDTGSISFTIRRPDARLAETVYVSTTFNRGSLNDDDYVGWLNIPVTFTAGDDDETVTIVINDDSSREAPETFGLIIQSWPDQPASKYLASSSFTILDDDASGGSGSFATGNDEVWIEPVVGARSYDGLAGTDLAILDLRSWSGGITSSSTSTTRSFASSGNSLHFTNVETFFVIAGSGNDALTGGSGVDGLVGGSGNDTLDGGGGSDVLIGGNGNDVFQGVGFAEIVDGGSGEDTVHFDLSSQTQAITIDLRTGEAADGWWTGVEFITGTLGQGDDTVTAGMQLATINGHTGVDLIVLDYSGTLADGRTATRVKLDSMSGTTGEEDVFLSGSTTAVKFSINDFERFAITGTAGDDEIRGRDSGNTLIGLGGNDTLTGGAGNDSLDGGAGNDFFGNVGVGDVLVGGTGQDTANVNLSDVTAAMTIDLLTGQGAGAGTSWTGVEFITGTMGQGDDTVMAGMQLATILGHGGTDLIVLDYSGTLADGRTATQVLFQALAHSNNELVYLSGSTTAVQFAINDFERFAITGTAGDDEIRGGNAGNTLIGLDGNDTLTGGVGNDSLDGGAEDDRLDGGAGNDVYVVDSPGDVIVENVGAGFDTVLAHVSWTLSNHLEALALLGSASINGTGNGLDNHVKGNIAANRLAGSSGNDTVEGGDGADSLDGGGGNDSVDGGGGVDTAVFSGHRADYSITALPGGGLVVQDLRSGAPDGADTLIGVEVQQFADQRITFLGGGTDSAETLTGTVGPDLFHAIGGNDVLYGHADADTLDGGEGADTMLGGPGDDAYFIDGLADRILETRTGGADTVHASLTWTLGAHQEDLVLTGTDAIDGTGNNLANVITGNVAANTLLGGGRADTLIGGGGNDLYLIDATDVLIEQAGGGNDTVVANATFALPDHIEVLRFNGIANVRGDGNAGDNFILGNVGNNRLVGYDGNDTLNGGLGNDTLQGGEGADSLVGGEGADRLDGGNGDDTYVLADADVVIELANAGIDTVLSNISYTLPGAVENLTLLGSGDIAGTGNALDNVLTGNGGANVLRGLGGDDRLSGGQAGDTLEGGLGADTLTGSGGFDHFLWMSPTEGGDAVEDFRPGDDKLAFLAGGFGGLAVVTLSQNAAADAAAQFIYTKATGVLEWDADGTGGIAAVTIATLSNKPTLAATDFVLA
ncbi:hypothetical protein DFH01_23670 [Falsiroseomonas bella]|uniref:Peptidase M23 domain-containing protein n=1 Tax=Falsiroseomonas bella TaxID=2184016 RepID=A0A317F751_9PROT|nr:peptidoglycan DD-metalloendopeptidase family protein [Falsiroseomonas bella]PWS34545.1 hypothetical protein DFH01_23670 [Falsiroseomonas bella]